MKATVYKNGNGQYFVRVTASNGAILAHSEQYVAKADATNCANIIAGGGTVADGT